MQIMNSCSHYRVSARRARHDIEIFRSARSKCRLQYRFSRREISQVNNYGKIRSLFAARKITISPARAARGLQTPVELSGLCRVVSRVKKTRVLPGPGAGKYPDPGPGFFEPG